MQKKRFLVAFVLCFFCGTTPVSAQDNFSVGQLTKEVVADPATWTPTSLFWVATQGDWNSSWVLFRQGGYIERNRDYTLSGKSYDTPISFGAGSRKIACASVGILGRSILVNVGAQASVHFLSQRFPAHKRFFTTIGWVVRIGGGVILGKDALPHFTQWRRNNYLSRNQPK